MKVYFFVLASSCLLCWLDRWRPVQVSGDFTAEKKVRLFRFYELACAIILLLAVIRAPTLGADADNYQRSFYSGFRSVGGFEPGYKLLEWLVAYFTDDFQLFLAICACLTLIPMLYVVYKESKNYLCLAMLIFLAEAYASSFTLIRGSLALACCYIVFRYQIQNKNSVLIPVILSVLAISFHYSIIVIVIVLLFFRPKWNSYYTIIAVMGTLMMTRIRPLVYLILKMTKKPLSYVTMPDRFQSYVPALNFLLFGALTVLCILYYDKLLERNENNTILISMSVVGLCITTGLYWFSMTIRIVQLFRYFCVFIIPELIACEQNKAFRAILIVCFTVFYFFLFIFFTTGNNKVIPYQTFFS